MADSAPSSTFSVTCCVFLPAKMSPVLLVQVDNQIPIVLNRESSFIRGIPGMGVLSGFMEPW
jgi:hypothetical protein